MKKFLKAAVGVLCAGSILAGSFAGFHAAGPETTTVQVSVTNKPTVDICLASKETDTDLSTFEQDVRNKLQQLGVDTSNIKFNTAETVDNIVDANNASTIIKNYKTFPQNLASNWFFDSSKNAITSTVNEPYETGFYSDNDGLIRNIELSSDIYATENSQPVGIFIRFAPQHDNKDRYDGYFLWVSSNAGGGGNNSVIILFKVKGLIIDHNKRIQYEFISPDVNTPAYQSMPLDVHYYDGANRMGWLWQTDAIPNYGGYPQGTILKNGSVATHVYDKGLTSEVLGHHFASLTQNVSLKIKAEGDGITCYLNGQQVITAKDSDIKRGYYGLFETSHVNPLFYNITAKYQKYKQYKDIISQPQWRDEAHHIVVNVDDYTDESLTGTDEIGEILTKTLNSDIHFIQWGTNENKNQSLDFIKQNDNNGLFTDNNNYGNSIQQTAQYIKDLIDQDKESQWVIVGNPTNINVTPSYLKTGAISSDFPNGRWMVRHDYKYFDNNEGPSANAGFYTPDLICTFDKPGKYDIYFDDQLVKTIYAHRIPSAAFNMKIISGRVELTSASRDLDSNVDIGLGKGIASDSWYYKEATAASWTSGKLSSFDVNKSYLIKHVVTDKQGESAEEVKHVGRGKPVAMFDYNKQTFTKYEPLTVNDSSYDPKGLALTKRTWVLEKNGKVVGTYSSPVTNFNASGLGEGNYRYTLTVTNSNGDVSNSYSQEFSIIADKEAPAIATTPYKCDWKRSQDIKIELFDNGSGLRNWQYMFSPSRTAPTSGWSALRTDKTATVNINTDGRNYIHVRAYDNAGNTIVRTAGIYNIDKQPPVINSVKKTHITSNNTVELTINAQDALSGLIGGNAAYGISEVNDSTKAQWGSSNKKTVTKNGTYYIFVKDYVGNMSGGSAGADSSTNGYAVTVTEITTKVNVSLTWNDNSNKHMTRPREVMVYLYRDGQPIKQHRLTGSGNTWNHVFDELPILDANGNKYSYTLSYDEIKSQKKPSDGYSSYGTYMDSSDPLVSVVYNINADLINVNTGNSTPPEEIPTPDPGEEIPDIESPYGPDPDAEENGYTIKGNINWVDNNNTLGYRPKKVVLKLLKNGELFTQATLNVSDGNSDAYKFTNLPKYDENLEVFEYTVIESFISWYVVDGKILNAYSIDNDTKTNEYNNGDTYGVIDFTNTFIDTKKIPEVYPEIHPDENGDVPVIPGKRPYHTSLYITHDADDSIPITLRMFEAFYNGGNVTYGEYNGFEYNLAVYGDGILIDDIKPGKYEILCGDFQYSINGITAEEARIEQEGDKYFLYIETTNKDVLARAHIDFSNKKEQGFQAIDEVKNFFSAHMEAVQNLALLISDEFLEIPDDMENNIMNVSGITAAISDPVSPSEFQEFKIIFYDEDGMELDVITCKNGDEIVIPGYDKNTNEEDSSEEDVFIGKDEEFIGKDVFIGWSLSKDGEADYNEGDSIIVSPDMFDDYELRLYPVVKAEEVESSETTDNSEAVESDDESGKSEDGETVDGETEATKVIDDETDVDVENNEIVKSNESENDIEDEGSDSENTDEPSKSYSDDDIEE